jgi:stearoyl-CoA desaturase (delta-9 desaturase)
MKTATETSAVRNWPTIPVRANATLWQRRIALAVVVLPFLGFVAATALAIRKGIGVVEICSLAIMYLLTMGGVSIGFHRYFAHRAFEAGPRTTAVLAVLGSMAAQGPILFWVAMHRRHHAFSDKPGDPHSPHVNCPKRFGTILGLWHAHIGWMFTEDLPDWVSFAHDHMHDRRIFRIHRLYFLWVAAGLLLPAIVAGVLTRSWYGAWLGLLWGGFVRAFLVNQASWCVGSVCHYFGTQPFETHDHSANNYLVALVTFGEGLQNNHHAFPSAARHGLAWWEPDLSGVVIRLLASAGLVWDMRHPATGAIARLRKI